VRPVNLVPHEQRRRTPSDGPGKGAHAALGVLALLLAMVVAYVLTANTVTERQNKTEAARVEADRLVAQAAQNGDFSEFAAIAQTRLQSVAGVAASRFDWERFMRELARVMPAGSWLQTADASMTGDPAATGTGAPATASPSANLVGCTPDQSDTAQLIVRLRQLHRVEDVEIGSSTQEDDETQAGIESCGTNYKFDLILKFSPGAPLSEAPQGETRVPASLGGGS
jgi:Tfp pilus assembly protein PilN